AGTPTQGVRIPGEHVVGTHRVGVRAVAATTVGLRAVVLPDTAQIVVEVGGRRGVGHVVVGALPVEVDVRAHTEALVVHHPITIADTEAIIGNTLLRHVLLAAQTGGRAGVVEPVVVLVRTFEEVDADGGRRRVGTTVTDLA